MARYRRSRRTVGNRPATAFAPGEKGGKTIAWESLYQQFVPVALATAFPLTVRTTGANDTIAVAVIPGSVTRGTVTLERVRGQMEVYFSSTELAAALANWPVVISLQVVQLVGGSIKASSSLSPMNAADQESNKIIWQRTYYPRAGTTITSPGGLEVHESSYVGIEVDIKVKRRFDRATWALALVCEAEAGAQLLHLTSGFLRALFRTGDGI